MEEMMMVMMKIRSREDPSNDTLKIPVIPAWKLYENPFYTPHLKPHNHHQDCSDHQQKQIHRLHLPVSARKIAASFWDLTFVKQRSLELEMSREQVAELRAELECERKARKKMEALNRRLARELTEERREREAMEKVCEELTKEISGNRDEINRMKREMDDERRMLRTAEVIREERVQMKLAEAKIILEEKLTELEICKKMEETSSSRKEGSVDETSFGGKLRFVSSLVKGKDSAENPHIKRGIKGFVEFPRGIGCRSRNHLGSKLECQKAQLKILLKQKGTATRFNGLIAS